MDYDSEIYSNGALEAGTAFITPFFIWLRGPDARF
jgi:hypothetical protein